MGTDAEQHGNAEKKVHNRQDSFTHNKKSRYRTSHLLNHNPESAVCVGATGAQYPRGKVRRPKFASQCCLSREFPAFVLISGPLPRMSPMRAGVACPGIPPACVP